MRSFGRIHAGGIVLGSLLGSAVLLANMTGCRGGRQPGVAAVDNSGADPADANMAQVGGFSASAQQPANAMYVPSQGSRRLLETSAGRVSGVRMSNVSQQAVEQYPQSAQSAAPIERRAPQVVPAQDQGYTGTAAPLDRTSDRNYPDPNNPGQSNPDQTNPDQNYGPQGYSNGSDQDQGPAQWSDGEQDAYSQVTEEAEDAPPPLPVYEQPPAPAPNYLWTPGYWSYAPAGYYWVPGAWIAAPFPGALWTPGYWGLWHRHYGYHPGYWGRSIGFYGGVAYGCGYYGSGYHGGYWRGNDFFYNQAVNRVNIVNIHNVYNRTVVVNNVNINHTIGEDRSVALNRVSYNGGRGGIQARPAMAEVAAFQGPRVAPMSSQLQIQRAAALNRQQFFKQNLGRPMIAAAPRPLAADHVVAPPAVRTAFDAGRGEPIHLSQQQAVSQSQPEIRTGPGVLGGQVRSNVEQQRRQQMQTRQQGAQLPANPEQRTQQQRFENEQRKIAPGQMRVQQPQSADQQQRAQEQRRLEQQQTIQQQARQQNLGNVQQYQRVAEQQQRMHAEGQQSQQIQQGRQQQSATQQDRPRQQQGVAQTEIQRSQTNAQQSQRIAEQQRVLEEQQRLQQVQAVQQQRTAQAEQIRMQQAQGRLPEQQQRIQQQQIQQQQQVQQQRQIQQQSQAVSQQQRRIPEQAQQQERVSQQQQRQVQQQQRFGQRSQADSAPRQGSRPDLQQPANRRENMPQR